MANNPFTFEHKDFYGANPYVIRKKDLTYGQVYADMEAKFTAMPMEIPMPVEEKKKPPVEVGYRCVKVDFNNKRTYGVVTYVNRIGLDYVIKIAWDDGNFDHQYFSVLRKEMLICPPESV
jgi:hypothetical protein